MRAVALSVVLLSCAAFGHPSGFHKKLTITVTPHRLTVLVVVDIDSGKRCLLLREPADTDRDGLLDGEELTQLKTRLTRLALNPLKLSLSGAPLTIPVVESKLSLREDRRANDTGLSVAVLLELELTTPFHEGSELEVVDVAPDTSDISVQIFQQGAKEPPFTVELPSGSKAKARIGAMK